VALMVDNIELAMETLSHRGFTMITEADLQENESHAGGPGGGAPPAGGVGGGGGGGGG
jgi:hypothetical protein